MSNFSGAHETEPFAKLVLSGKRRFLFSLSSDLCRVTYFYVYVPSCPHYVSKIDVTLPKFMGRVMRKLESSTIPNFRLISNILVEVDP